MTSAFSLARCPAIDAICLPPRLLQVLHLQEMVGRDEGQIERLEAELKLSKKEVKTLAAERNARDEQVTNMGSHATTLEQELQQVTEQVGGRGQATDTHDDWLETLPECVCSTGSGPQACCHAPAPSCTAVHHETCVAR